MLSVAVGILAVRCAATGPGYSWRLTLATGAVIAAIPLVHGVGGGTWIYCVGTWAVAATLLQARSLRGTLTGLTVSAAWAAFFLGIYQWCGSLSVTPQDMETTRVFVQNNAPSGEGWQAWLAAVSYVRKDSGSAIVVAGWAGCVWLALAWHSARAATRRSMADAGDGRRRCTLVRLAWLVFALSRANAVLGGA